MYLQKIKVLSLKVSLESKRNFLFCYCQFDSKIYEQTIMTAQPDCVIIIYSQGSK